MCPPPPSTVESVERWVLAEMLLWFSLPFVATSKRTCTARPLRPPSHVPSICKFIHSKLMRRHRTGALGAKAAVAWW
uniref:Putative secreted protein n=1 Tax=Anopheles darlingi TaxID=43151 RepID=A0A2M4D9L9_ANODA